MCYIHYHLFIFTIKNVRWVITVNNTHPYTPTIPMPPQQTKTYSHIDPNKATAPDLDRSILLKEAMTELSIPLFSMFNLFLSNSFVSANIYKQYTVSLIFKIPDPSGPTYYRPVSLFNYVGKLIKLKIVFGIVVFFISFFVCFSLFLWSNLNLKLLSYRVSELYPSAR